VRGGDDLAKFDPEETRNRSGREVADAAGRWEKILATEPELFRGVDIYADVEMRKKVYVLPIPHVSGLLEAIEQHAAQLGPIHGIINILGDSGLGGTEESKRANNADAPHALYEACRSAPQGHPLATVEGFVQATTIGIKEKYGRLPEEQYEGHPDRKYRLVTERAWPKVVNMDGSKGAKGGGSAGYIKGKARLEALLQRSSGEAPPANGRHVPCCVIRPGGIIGCSNLPGGLLPGWSNSGNMNMPLCNFLFWGQPDAKTPPKIGFLPPPAFLARAKLPTIPVDVCVNQHVVSLAVLMAHPDRPRIGGDLMPVFNSAHDSQLNGFSFWDFLNGMPHFDETKFDYLNRRGFQLLKAHAKNLEGTSEGKELQKEIKNYQTVAAGMTGRPSWDLVQVGSVDWLAASMHETDKTGPKAWPVQFSGEPGFEAYDFKENIRLNHDYFWKHIAQTNRSKM